MLPLSDVRVTALGLITSCPFVLLTVNWSVTSVPSAALTTAVPVISDVYVPASVPDALAVSPSTVYRLPSTVNSVALSPLTDCSLPS